jgi:hypothetical protein
MSIYVLKDYILGTKQGHGMLPAWRIVSVTIDIQQSPAPAYLRSLAARLLIHPRRDGDGPFPDPNCWMSAPVGARAGSSKFHEAGASSSPSF